LNGRTLALGAAAFLMQAAVFLAWTFASLDLDYRPAMPFGHGVALGLHFAALMAPALLLDVFVGARILRGRPDPARSGMRGGLVGGALAAAAMALALAYSARFCILGCPEPTPLFDLLVSVAAGALAFLGCLGAGWRAEGLRRRRQFVLLLVATLFALTPLMSIASRPLWPLLPAALARDPFLLLTFLVWGALAVPVAGFVAARALQPAGGVLRALRWGWPAVAAWSLITLAPALFPYSPVSGGTGIAVPGSHQLSLALMEGLVALAACVLAGLASRRKPATPGAAADAEAERAG
jgi:hypothetical protein